MLSKGLAAASVLAAIVFWLWASRPVSAETSISHAASTPIRHLIVIVGENHTYDNLFGAYRPREGQETVNLLSERIINADGSPGPNWSKARQWQAKDTGEYSIAPERTGPYSSLPQPNTTYAFGCIRPEIWRTGSALSRESS